ncbi:MAG: HAD-IIB family hydrolase [Candidatus Bathyarchaeota archaeon]|nr:HAD-IIB family hydrolase [Candidatus Bathyarchaeota archaeon]
MKPKNVKILVFADLDGTILDDQYDYSETQPILRELLARDASIVLASSKTKSEIEFYQKQLCIVDPFIVENGSAIFIPQGFFSVTYPFTKRTEAYSVIELGTPYATVREKLLALKRKTSADIVGYGDLSIEEVAQDSGLPLSLAALSKDREYDEPFKILKGNSQQVLDAIEAEGLCFNKGGRYYHLLGCSDKGKAVSILKNLFLQQYQDIVSFGIGDGDNDLPMLRQVDHPYWLGKGTKKTKNDTWQDLLAEVIQCSGQ